MSTSILAFNSWNARSPARERLPLRDDVEIVS
jgi:hypothetical protein